MEDKTKSDKAEEKAPVKKPKTPAQKESEEPPELGKDLDIGQKGKDKKGRDIDYFKLTVILLWVLVFLLILALSSR